MINELFLTLCLSTSLPCADISVRTYEFNKREQKEAMAYMTKSGKMGVLLDDSTLRYSENKIKGLLVHELAHMVVWHTRPYDGDHGHKYTVICRKLALEAGVSPNNCKPMI